MAHRIERVNSLIRQEISELLQRQVKDPRLGNFVTVTEVMTAPDMKHARVLVSRLCDTGNEAKEKEEVLLALHSASAFLRRELGKNLRLRHIPELTFEWDSTIERGDHLLNLINQVCEEDDKDTTGSDDKRDSERQ